MLVDSEIPSGLFPGIVVSGDDAEAIDDTYVRVIDRDAPEPFRRVVYCNINRKMIAHDHRTNQNHPMTIDDIMECCRANDSYSAWQAKRGIKLCPST